MGQESGISGSSGGGLNLGGNRASGGSSSSSDFPCGTMPCADHTGDKTFVDADTPDDVADFFDGATLHEPGTDADREPIVIYPCDWTMFPINVSHIRHDWSAGGSDVFELRFVGPNTTVNVYTASLTWTPTDEQWDWIAESNRGAQVVLTVSGLDTSQPSV